MKSTVSQLCTGLDARVRAFNERALGSFPFLIIDAMCCKSRTDYDGVVSKTAVMISAVRAQSFCVDSLSALYPFVFTHVPGAKPVPTFAEHALNGWLFQLEWGTWSTKRSPTALHPVCLSILVFVEVSSMKTRRSIARFRYGIRPVFHSRRSHRYGVALRHKQSFFV